MAVSLVQGGGVHATTGAATVTLGAAPTDGNVLVAILGNNANNTTFAPTMTGWTALILPTTSGSSTAMAAWFKVAASDSATLSVTPSSGSIYELHYLEFSGATVPSVTAANTANSGASTVTTITVAASGSPSAGALLVAAAYFNTNTSAQTHSAGWSAAASSTRMVSAWTATQTSDTISWTTAGRVFAGIGAVNGTSTPASATASLTLTATGAGKAPTSSAASLTLTAGGTGQAPTTGTAALSLTASGTAKAPTTAAASLALTSTATGTAPATGTASLTLTSTAAAGGSSAAAGSATLTLTATTTAQARATSTAALNLTASATASAPAAASAGLSFTTTGSATTPASGNATLTFTTTATAHPAGPLRDLTITATLAGQPYTATLTPDRYNATVASDHLAAHLHPDRYTLTVHSDRYTLEVSMPRTIRTSIGDTAYIAMTLVEDNGQDLTASTFQVSLGTYQTPGDWRTPDVSTPVKTGTQQVKLLVGGAYTPDAGDYYPWCRITDSPETESVRATDTVTIT